MRRLALIGWGVGGARGRTPHSRYAAAAAGFTPVYKVSLYLNQTKTMTHCHDECCCWFRAYLLGTTLYCLTLLGSLGLCPSAVERETSTPARGKEITKSPMFTCQSDAGGVRGRGGREGKGGDAVRAALLARGRSTSRQAHEELDARPDPSRGEGPRDGATRRLQSLVEACGARECGRGLVKVAE